MWTDKMCIAYAHVMDNVGAGAMSVTIMAPDASCWRWAVCVDGMWHTMYAGPLESCMALNTCYANEGTTNVTHADEEMVDDYLDNFLSSMYGNPRRSTLAN